MIKKFIFIIVICFVMTNIVKGKENNNQLESAIRLRIIANSNSEYDQNIKMIVKEKIQEELSIILKDTTDIVESRNIINNNYSKLNALVAETLEQESYTKGYNMNYGYNYFPEKEYNGIIYKEGEYESLLITLGKGEGDNWWCILFPPLCLIEAEEDSEVKYESFFMNLINKIF